MTATFDSSTQLNSNEEDSNQIVDVIFCYEKQCLIIEEINKSMINEIINRLKEKDVIFIDVNMNWNDTNEIFNFYIHYHKLISQNKFIGYILKPTVGYLIKRYFYPSEYFKDPSFFNYGQLQKANEQKAILNLNHYLFIDHLTSKQKFKEIINEIKSDNSQIIKDDFKENDFIILKEIRITRYYSYFLVIHIESLYIFTMKKINFPDNLTKELDHEISFCNKYSHRCFVPFYGFLRSTSNKIIGFIYEFMTNDSLQNFKVHTKPNKKISLITAINRLIQGINYLQSKSLIHRDLKPSNLLINHDNQVFIYDYETIRYINNKNNLSEETFTYDYGVPEYTSPELSKGGIVSFPTDIFSLGKIINFLLDKQQKKNEEFKNITELIKKCTYENPDERPKCKEIIELIIKEIGNFHYYVQYLMSDEINQKEMIQFIYENIHLVDINQLNHYIDIIFDCFKTLYLSKFVFKNEKSLFLFQIGYFYENYFESELKAAKKYYLLSANLNNSDALNNLGLIYQNQNTKNKEEIKDIRLAIHYFELSAQMNNSFAYLNLAYLYYLNKDIKQDYQKAKEYFEKSAKLNNSFALLNLGNMYNYGEGVEKDYEKASQYYKISAKLNNSHAYNNLGYLYYYGKGVTKDILKAKKCFEMSAKLNNSHGFFFLGDLYSTGDCFDIDLNKAIKWLIKSSQIFDEKEIVQNSIKRYCSILHKYNKYYSRSNNDLGLIYITVFEDVDKAIYYLGKAASYSYPFAHNNYGLLYQFYLNEIKNAKMYFKRSTEKNFPLAYFNLGYLKEMKHKIEKSIKFYKDASKYENNILKRYHHQHFDKRLDISKTFIICLANLKIFEYYFSKTNYEDAKYYFIKSFSNLLLNSSYQFNFEFNEKKAKICFLI